MYDRPLPIEQMLTMLSEMPARIAALTSGLAPDKLRAAPNPGEWSANEVLAHLRSCADVWGNYIATIVAEDRPTIRAVNPTTWIKRTDYREQEFCPSFDAFARQRTGLVTFLEGLAPEAWSREAIVTGAGKPRVRTVHSYGEWLANHEWSHVKQIERIANAMRIATPTA